MHYNIRNVVDEETYEKNRYTNTERVFMVLLWPTVIYTLVVTLFTGTTVQDLEKKVEDRKKELDELKEDDKSE